MRKKIKRPNGYWTKENIIKAIHERLASGKSLTPSVVREDFPSLIAYGEKLYGKWADALLSAGIDYNDWYLHKPNGYWTEEVIRKELLKIKNEGKSLKVNDVEMENDGLVSAVRGRYGTWSEGLLAIGESNENHLTNRIGWSKDMVTKELLKRRKQGSSLILKDIMKEDQSLYKKMITYFGTAHKAYEAIKEDPKKYTVKREQRKWSKEKVLSELQLRKDNSQPMGASSVRDDDCRLYRSAIKYMGNWKEAMSQLESSDK